MAEVIVVAPTFREAARWCQDNGVAQRDAIIVSTESAPQLWKVAGYRGVPHVITRWGLISPFDQLAVRDALVAIASPPYGDVPTEPEDEDELCLASDEWR